jgi:hypothetical protein
VYIYYITAAGIARNSQLSNPYEVWKHRLFYHSRNQVPPHPAFNSSNLGRTLVYVNTLAISLVVQQSAKLIADSVENGEIAGVCRLSGVSRINT